MTIWLKQSTSADVVVGPFVDDTDGKTVETGLTISQADCQLSKNGGAVAQKNDATSASHLGGGHYKVPFNTTDTNTLGRLRLYVNESGALPVWQDFMVVPANVWDSMFGADYLQVDAVQLSGDSTAADNAELMFDGTGYAGGTTKLGVEIDSIDGSTSAPGQLKNVVGGSQILSVNTTQIGGDTLAALYAAAAYATIVAGAVVTGTLTRTAFTTGLTETTNDHYNGRTLTFRTGVLAGQMTTITDYDGATKMVTVTAMTEAPSNGDQFTIL